MNKNIFDKLSDSYEEFHLKDTKIQKGNDVIVISPRLKLMLGWSLFVLCFVLIYAFGDVPFGKHKEVSQEEKKDILTLEVDVDEEHPTMIPYQKDLDEDLNAFIAEYFKAITACDNLALQDMVINPREYNTADSLKKKAEFITGYENMTVYTKDGLDEGSYVAFVVTNVVIAGVNSSPYDITTLYVVNGERGFLINNGTLSQDTQDYIAKVRGDKDIQKVYRSIEKKNEEMKEKDPTLQQFYDIISRRNVETHSAADVLKNGEDSGEATGDQNASEESRDGESESENGEQTGEEAGEEAAGQQEQTVSETPQEETVPADGE